MSGFLKSRVIDASTRAGPIIVAVDAYGNDNDGSRPARITSGDYTAKPFLTLAAALAALPTLAESGSNFDPVAQINMGAGDFLGAVVSGFKIPLGITGTRIAATLTSGLVSGTATSGSATTITLTGAGWTVDDLIGRFVNVTSGPGNGAISVVRSNTVDTITFPRESSTPFAAGSVFAIEDQGTFITGAEYQGFISLGISYCDSVFLTDLIIDDTHGVAAFAAFGATDSGDTTFTRCIASSTWGFICSRNNSTSFDNCASVLITGSVGVSIQTVRKTGIVGCYFRGAGTGLNLNISVGVVFISQVYVDAFDQGIFAESVILVDMVDVGISGSAIAGIEMKRAGIIATRVDISNCAGPTTLMKFSTIDTRGTGGGFTGSGNSGFGIDLSGPGNQLLIGEAISMPTITGTSGELTVDGTTSNTWASVTAVGSSIVDPLTGSRFYRG